MLTNELFDMTFGQWCNETKGLALALTEFGDIDYREPRRAEAVEQYHDLWIAERKEYLLRDKNEKINAALMNLRAEGIECVLSNYQNGHIKAKNRHGVVMSFYATTGTIAGYKDTNVEGLDDFIRLLKR